MAITKEQAIDILDKFDFFQGQRAGRELWNDKPFEVQEQDIKDFSNDVALLKEYIADVVPKSEVEKLVQDVTRLEQEIETLKDNNEHLAVMLEEAKVELMNVCLDKTNCDDMIQYILDFYFKRKVAEVFAEIENALSDNFHADCQMGDCIEDYYDDNLRDDIAELKNKYTEEQNK